MKILRITVSALFVIIGVSFFLLLRAIRAEEDYTCPEIYCDSGLLEINIGDNRLMSGISAFDEKDGNLTDKVVVESISRFVEKGVCNITYAVSDSDNHVTKYTRKIKYADYISPRFIIFDEPSFFVGSTAYLDDYIGAFCVLDGEVSDKIKYDYGMLDMLIPGVYTIRAYVANSKGDVSEIFFDLNIRERNTKTPVIKLKQYILYAGTGDIIEPKEYILSALKADGITALDMADVHITTDLNTEKSGVYKITYHAEDAGSAYTVSMVCVVE